MRTQDRKLSEKDWTTLLAMQYPARLRPLVEHFHENGNTPTKGSDLKAKGLLGGRSSFQCIERLNAFWRQQTGLLYGVRDTQRGNSWHNNPLQDLRARIARLRRWVLTRRFFYFFNYLLSALNTKGQARLTLSRAELFARIVHKAKQYFAFLIDK